MQSNFTWFIGNFKLSLLGVVMLLITTSPLFSQNTISVRVEEGQATSTCTDGFDGEAEPLWQGNVNGEG